MDDPSFEPLEPGGQGVGVGGGLRSGEPDHGQLDHQPFLPALAQLDQRFTEEIDSSENRGRADHLGGLLPGLEHLWRLVDDLTEVGGVVGKEDPAEEANRLADESAQVDPPRRQLGHHLQGTLGITIGDRVGELRVNLVLGHAQRPLDTGQVDGACAQGGHLLEQRERVAS